MAMHGVPVACEHRMDPSAVTPQPRTQGAKVVVKGLPDDPISDVVTAILDVAAQPFRLPEMCPMMRQRAHRETRRS